MLPEKIVRFLMDNESDVEDVVTISVGLIEIAWVALIGYCSLFVVLPSIGRGMTNILESLK